MKKIMIMLAATTMAVGVHAAAISWSVVSVKDATGNLIGATTDKFTAVASLYAADGTFIKSSDPVTTSNAGSGFVGKISDTATSTSYYVQLVITAADGKTLTSEKAALTTSAAATYGINFTNGNGFSEKTAKIDFANWQGGGGGDVPEPTSAMLMLLGVAGLALRRKRA